MGGKVDTFLSRFIIVWADKSFDPSAGHYDEMDEYIKELNGYKFATCKGFDTAEGAAKQLGLRACPQAIIISSGSLCKWEKPETLLDIIKRTPGASKRVIDHIIYCGDEDAYKPT